VAIPIEKDKQKAFNLVGACIISVIIWSLLIAVIFILQGREIASYLNVQSMLKSTWLLPIAIVAGGIVKTFMMWSIRQDAYKNIASSNILQSVGNCTFQIIFGLFPKFNVGLILADTIGRVTGAGVFAHATLKWDPSSIKQLSFSG